MKWSTAEQLKYLLYQLVGWDSRTGTVGEVEFPKRLQELIRSLDYFQKNDDQLKLNNVGQGRQALTALYKTDKTEKTIVLMSHFDTVHVEEYGASAENAFYPDKLTEQLKFQMKQLAPEIQDDLCSDKYLFGRGTMDMKMGLAMHIHLLEKAIVHQWPINILLVTVPDEEANSAGMRSVIPKLVNMKERFSIHYELIINSEPTFTDRNTEETYHIYTGSVGKIMPAALFYGKETHAGQPLSGINSHIMSTFLTKAMEWNTNFIEEEGGEKTPLPICLQMNDLKTGYSVQTSHHSYALYNVFLFKRNAEQIMQLFKRTAIEAMKECDAQYEVASESQQLNRQINHIKVMEYEELRSYAQKKISKELLNEMENEVFLNDLMDDRKKSVELCDLYMSYCPELAPATIVFFAPPYYPAVTTADHKMNKELVPSIKKMIKENFHIDAKHIHYFPGISDLSYINYHQHDEGWQSYKNNTPGWGLWYEIPFEAMKQLQVPVINIGPFGKDAHKKTERLHKKSAFVHTPYIIEQLIKKYLYKRPC